MDSPAAYPDSPMEQDDAAYPCKGCGEILEEGKAFELAGNRWHIDCFRCNTCGTLLDSDANLLLLGDGSLICNNCTYSCCACGNKIEDLAILTGDQAFCASCFRCRNCKRKIDNLKYARTSQGIFCMECYETLTDRRRKKSAKNPSRRPKPSSNGAAMLLDKSLPSLPPNVTPEASSGDRDTPPSEIYSDHTLVDPAPRRLPSNARPGSSRSTQRERSPAALEESRKENLMLPSSTYKSNRHSTISQKSDVSGNGEDFFIPMALDPNPAPGPSPHTNNHKFDREHGEQNKPQAAETRSGTRDYFSHTKPVNSSVRKHSQDRHGVQGEGDGEHTSSPPTSPHIAYQEKGRQPSSELIDTIRKRKDHGATNISNSAGASPAVGNDKTRVQHAYSPKVAHTGQDPASQGDKFKLQEVPKNKKSGGSARSSKSEGPSPLSEGAGISGVLRSYSGPAAVRTKDQIAPAAVHDSPKPLLSELNINGAARTSLDHRSRETGSVDPTRALPSAMTTHLPKRGDSLGKSQTTQTTQAVPRKEIKTSGLEKIPTSSLPLDGQHDTSSSASSITTTHESPSVLARINGAKIASKPGRSPTSKSAEEKPTPPARAQGRSLMANPTNDSFTAPRAPPQPPPGYHKSRDASISTLQSEPSHWADPPASPALPRYSTGGEFTMEDDMARILGTDESKEHASFLRRVSNSVRHGRSYSDKVGRMSKDSRWPSSPLHVIGTTGFGPEINSPSTSSPETRDELMWFKNELRRERQKTVEKEQKIAELEAALEGKASIKQVNTELREKRSTMVVLDTQKEIVVRELEVLTEHIATAKKSREPLDLGKLSNNVLREFAEALQKLKDSFAPQIEDLIQKRNELIDEVANLTQMKDKSLQEFEQLSLKNAQLAELNNQLVHQIQGLYRANAAPSFDGIRPPPNGLGIYTHHPKETSQVSVDGRDMGPGGSESSHPGSQYNIHPENDADHAAILTAPQMVNIRKGQPKKFNWKKGGQNVAKGVTKGLKGAFSSNDQAKYQREGGIIEGLPYGSLPSGSDYHNGSLPRPAMNDPARQGFGFFNTQKAKPGPSRITPNGSSAMVGSESGTALFGSELEQRTDFERVVIPGIVTRCIQEVELRGMDVEGIYRKSGGNGQIQIIREGFERSNDFDISDPDLDINAVTSLLKQYFRRLPTPLITYEVYDQLLDSVQIADDEKRIASMRLAIQNLPPSHRDCLEFLIFHLARVVEREKENLMTPLNIAVVFAPTIMRPESLSREMTDTQMKNQAIQFLVENSNNVFMEES